MFPQLKIWGCGIKILRFTKLPAKAKKVLSLGKGFQEMSHVTNNQVRNANFNTTEIISIDVADTFGKTNQTATKTAGATCLLLIAWCVRNTRL